MAKVSDIIRLAKTQLGYKDGDKQVLEYIHNWEPSWGANTPWCACFTTWLGDKLGMNIIRSASVPTIVRNAKQQGLWVTPGNQRDGDFIVYTFSANRNPDHIGLYIGGGQSIDGNWNNQVMYHTATNVLGYVRNAYEAESISKKVKVVYSGSEGLNLRNSANFSGSISRVAKKGDILKVVADIGDMYMLENFEYVSKDKKYVVDDVENAKPSSAKIKIPTSVDRWRVYSLGEAPVSGNECGFLKPSVFADEAAYLEYEVIDWIQPDVAIIKTRDFGQVQIYVGSDTSAIIE